MRQNYSNIIGMGIMTDLKSQQLVLITFTSITSLPSKKYTLVLLIQKKLLIADRQK